jgi:hypothetical protein
MWNRYAGLCAVAIGGRSFQVVGAVGEGSQAAHTREKVEICLDGRGSAGRQRAVSEKFQQIVRQADQSPFALHLLQATK